MNAMTRSIVLHALLLFGTLGNAAFALPLEAEAVEQVIALDQQADKIHSERMAAIRSAFNDLQPNY